MRRPYYVCACTRRLSGRTAIPTALDALLAIDGGIQAGGVVFLARSQ